MPITYDRRELMKKLEEVTPSYIKLRDWAKPCPSCGSQHNPSFDAGHYHKRSVEPAIKYHELNIHAQCIECNRFKNGMQTEFKRGLILRLGAEKFRELELLPKTQIRFTNWELAQLVEYRKNQIKILKERIKANE